MMIRTAALLLALTSFPAQAGEHTPLFEYKGRPYAVNDLSMRMQRLHGQVLHDQYKAMRTLIDEMLFDVYVEQQAAQQKRPIREVGMELLAVADPTAAQARQFYDRNRTRINRPFEQVSEQIRQELKRERVLQHREQLIARLKKEGKFALLLPQPPAVIADINTEGRPLRGDPSAPITLVEFADYQCPKCKHAVKLIKDLISEYPQDIKLVYMDFPINRSGISTQVAYGGVCAQNQDRFWAYHDAAFDSQASLSKESPRMLAAQVGLDMKKFDDCMLAPATHDKIAASQKQGQRLGVNATPTLFVDGRAFPSQDLPRDLGAYIAKKRARTTNMNN